MNSPITGKPMREIEYEGTILFTCPDSGGEFIGPEALSHIVRTRDEQMDPAVRDALADRQPQAGIDSGEVERKFNCPGCEGTMRIVNYAGDSGVHIDRCESCGGVWLDSDELEHIQILMERWKDEASEKLNAIAGTLEMARQENESQMRNTFNASRFAFVNAIMNRFLDAA